MSKSAKTVYSTDKGRLCPKCGWPATDCRCAKTFEQDVPGKIVVTLRIEKSGRGGKTVTVVDGLPRNKAFIQALAAELKKSLGTGGTSEESSLEIQGDRRDAIRQKLESKGWRVKG